MTSPDAILRRVVEECESLGLPYFITDSVASMFYGESRSTSDIDVVVAIDVARITEFCGSFPEPTYYVSVDAARAAAAGAGQFNIIEPAQGVKADIIIPRPSPHHEAMLRRAKRVEVVAGLGAMLASAEDVILSKRVFFREGGSDKHVRDIASMLRVQGDAIDLGYVNRWAARLGVANEWDTVRRRLRSP